MSDLVERLRERSCYASTNSEWPNRELQEAADRIEELEGIVRGLLKRIDLNGGLGQYKGGPAFIVEKARAALGE